VGEDLDKCEKDVVYAAWSARRVYWAEELGYSTERWRWPGFEGAMDHGTPIHMALAIYRDGDDVDHYLGRCATRRYPLK
jgi:hypothetical protein